MGILTVDSTVPNFGDGDDVGVLAFGHGYHYAARVNMCVYGGDVDLWADAFLLPLSVREHRSRIPLYRRALCPTHLAHLIATPVMLDSVTM